MSSPPAKPASETPQPVLSPPRPRPPGLPVIVARFDFSHVLPQKGGH